MIHFEDIHNPLDSNTGFAPCMQALQEAHLKKAFASDKAAFHTCSVSTLSINRMFHEQSDAIAQRLVQ